VSHILSGCKVALKQGRYTYHHENILAGIVKCMQHFLFTYSPSLSSEDDTINFVRAGNECSSVPKSIIGILYKMIENDDWKLSFDSVDQNLVIPPYLAIRPDILLISKRSRRVVLVELTSPCEENMEGLEEYAPLCSAISQKGWKVNCFVVEL